MERNLNKQEGKTSIQEKRAYLKELSRPLKELKLLGEIKTINEGLTSIYAHQGHTELKTIQQWNKEGFRVKKGESAFLLWGNKKQKTGKENEDNKDAEELDFFPLCFVFSNLQIQSAR